MTDLSEQQTNEDKRDRGDRRSYSIKGLVFSLFKGRRKGPQRANEQNDSYITDFFEPSILWFVASIMALSAADALFTLSIIALGGEEVNPVMKWALGHGPQIFFGLKFFLTALGLLICLIHIKFKIFKRWGMEVIIYGLFLGYCALITYEITLIRHMIY